MRVEERIVQEAVKAAGDRTVDAVCIGVGYTGVRLSDGHGGVSYTFRDELGPSCGVIRNAGELKGMPASEAAGCCGLSRRAEAAWISPRRRRNFWKGYKTRFRGSPKLTLLIHGSD